MNRLYKLLFIMFLGTFFASCSATKKTGSRRNPEIKNIILMIGDGMGLAHVDAAMTFSASPLNIERCSVIGLQKTFSADNYITD